MKGVLKVSKEQVIEIERYCDELGITRKQRIDELGLSHTAYYYTRSLLSEEELHGGQFIPIMSGIVVPCPSIGYHYTTKKQDQLFGTQH